MLDPNQNTETQSPSVPPNLTSIIILTYNQLDYTRKCLYSIYAHTRCPYELIFVDNGSSDGTLDYLRSEQAAWSTRGPAGCCQNFRLISNRENLGFAAGNDQGLAVAQGAYLLLLNNDTVVTPHWLERLLACAERDPRIGLVGPRSNYVSGPQQVADPGYNTQDLTGLDEFARRWSRKNQGQAQPFWRVVGFCMLIKRKVIDKIGGLDSRFGRGNFEDDDFCMRALLAGFVACIAGDCFIHHFGNRTFLGANINFQESLLKNWEIFKNKWQLPPTAAYGAPCDLSPILRQGFLPEHYFPLENPAHMAPRHS